MERLGAMDKVMAYLLIIVTIAVIIIRNKNKVNTQYNNSNIEKMGKHYLQSQIKSSGTAYLLWFFFGFHYAYLGKWLLQFLYWITLGGFFIWAIIDLFTLSSRVANHNALIYQQIEEIEKKDRDAEQARNLAMIMAAKGN